MNIRYYDRLKKALVYCHQRSSPQMWDRHWLTENVAASITRKNRFLNRVTTGYLQSGAKILEGGCGTGRNVFSLQQIGFDAYGIDYATKTVALAHSLFPELKILEGDVRHLPFHAASFDGYWSLGVIEHFFEGFNDIAVEMARVIRPDGYLFLSFPHMHSLRRLKARLGLYPLLPDRFAPDKDNFYQFALPEEGVISYFRNLGFELVSRKRTAGLKGFKDEIGWCRPLLQRMYDSRLFVVQVGNKLLDLLLSRYCGHSILLILRKGQKTANSEY
jgi:SAM-dependent methyltransferase